MLTISKVENFVRHTVKKEGLTILNIHTEGDECYDYGTYFYVDVTIKEKISEKVEHRIIRKVERRLNEYRNRRTDNFFGIQINTID